MVLFLKPFISGVSVSVGTIRKIGYGIARIHVISWTLTWLLLLLIQFSVKRYSKRVCIHLLLWIMFSANKWLP